MMDALELINIGSKKLKIHKIRSNCLDSEILLSSVLGKKREEILINPTKLINDSTILKFKDLIKRRSLHEPVAYILKEKEFWSKKFMVNQNTLIPRPETELIIDKLIKIYKDKKIFILDIGTGSGCIIISLLSELKNSYGEGIDISKKATEIAKINVKNHNLTERVKLLKKSFLEIYNKKYDLVVSNPPYIERGKLKNLDDDIRNYEPLVALDGGNDGLDVIKKVIYKAKNILKFKGILALEIGRGQYKKVSKILKANNFKTEHIVKDYKENIRCLILKLIK